MPTDKPRFSFTVSEETLEQVEDYQQKKGYATRNKAMLELIQIGIDSLLVNAPAALVPAPISEEAKELLPLYEKLDQKDKIRVIGQVEGLLMNEKYKQERQSKHA